MHDKSAPPSETPDTCKHVVSLKNGESTTLILNTAMTACPYCQINALERRLRETEAERDLAITHDRQPYPTAWAYEQVCKARDQWQQRAEELQRKLSAARKESDDKG